MNATSHSPLYCLCGCYVFTHFSAKEAEGILCLAKNCCTSWAE